MAARMGINEADQNHMTLMCPTKPRTFLSIGRGSLWSRVKAGELLEVSVDDDDYQPDQPDSGDSYGSKAVNGYMLDLESSAWVIHAPLHRARPDAAAILHTHMPFTTALASLEDPTLQMCNLNCFRFCASCAICHCLAVSICRLLLRLLRLLRLPPLLLLLLLLLLLYTAANQQPLACTGTDHS
jgi:ribulose-5-phosphate 4-epimerase/fuculose-1-phosphate aldolase